MVVKSGPVKEVVLTGDRADLRSLPIVTHCEKDAGPYISAGVTIMRDPASGALNAGIYRNRVLSPTRLTMNMAPLCHASQITAQAEARQEHVEAAIVIGHHPAMGMASQQRGTLAECELETMGGLLGEPVELVRCETVDVFVPSDAEIVIEGRIRTDAWDDLLLVLEERWRPTGLGGVMHCFGAGWEQARRSLDLGFLVSFAGNLTYPKAQPLRDVAARLPLYGVLVETDAPWLAPAPHRGQRNEPAWVSLTARSLAAARGAGEEEIAAETTKNFFRLFDLRPDVGN